VAALVVAAGIFARVHADQSLKTWTHDQAIPTVALAKVDGGGQRELVLPGDVRPSTPPRFTPGPAAI
jgi:hypothetical protein